MTIEKGRAWGTAGGLPDGGVVVSSDAQARSVVERARRKGEPPPVLGLMAGDLCRTLGGTGDESRLRGPDGMRFPIDLGEVLVDGRLFVFVAHLVARTRLWTRVFAAMNAQFIGSWDVAPRAHPNDGLLDTYDVRLPLGDLPKVRARLPQGAHLPHPGITERRTASVQVTLDRTLAVWLDGERVGEGRVLSVRVEPDALTVVV